MAEKRRLFALLLAPPIQALNTEVTYDLAIEDVSPGMTVESNFTYENHHTEAVELTLVHIEPQYHNALTQHTTVEIDAMHQSKAGETIEIPVTVSVSPSAGNEIQQLSEVYHIVLQAHGKEETLQRELALPSAGVTSLLLVIGLLVFLVGKWLYEANH